MGFRGSEVQILSPRPSKIKGLGDVSLSPFCLPPYFLQLLYNFRMIYRYIFSDLMPVIGQGDVVGQILQVSKGS
jgi:hypothetical protein